jgi:hypothetical protein
MNDRHPPGVTHDPGGSDGPIEVVVKEARPGAGEAFGSRFHYGTYQRAAGEKNEEKKTVHALCVCKCRTALTSLFSDNNKLFLRLWFYR